MRYYRCSWRVALAVTTLRADQCASTCADNAAPASWHIAPSDPPVTCTAIFSNTHSLHLLPVLHTTASYWLRFYVPLNTKQVISKTFPKPISWLGMEKQKLLQQQHIFTYQKKCTTTQNKHKKTQARFSCLLRHPAWKWSGPILVSALHKFVTYLLTYLDTYLLTAPDPHGAISQFWVYLCCP